jgi:two-component system sensor histidine kinase ChvG
MRLRAQLIIVSLVALFLPWAGCQYVAEMENALREGQQDMLLKVGGAVASVIEAQPEMLLELEPLPKVPGATTLFLHTDSKQALNVDGYADVGMAREVQAVFSEAYSGAHDSPPLELRAYLMAVGDKAYLYAAVNDTEASMRKPSSSVSLDGVDHIELVMGSADNMRQVLLAPEAVGQFSAQRRSGRQLIAEYNARGTWRRHSSGGYGVELMLPRAWLGDFFGIIARDGNVPGREAGSLSPSGEAGALLKPSDKLERLLGNFSNEIDLRVLDIEKLQRAARVNDNLREPVTRASGAWFLEWLYRRVSSGRSDDNIYRAPVAGKFLRDEANEALVEGGMARWYELADDSDAAVVSAALRITDTTAERPVGLVIAERSSADIVSLTNATLVRFAGVTMLLIVAIFGGLLGYATWLSIRISRLSKQVMTVIEPQGKELRAFPEQTAPDEIGQLGRNFGRLLGRVRGYTEYLQSLASKLSHELRTPLAVVHSSLDNLEHEALSADARVYVQRAKNGSDRLSHLLTAMSEASRMEQAIQSADKEAVELTILVDKVVSGYRTAYPKQVIELKVPDSTVEINASPELLAQLLDKLMDNARDFCDEGGAICFSVERSASTALLIVENDGPLLPEGMAEQLFESMVSVREGKSETVHMGLGLAIVRLVAEFHGGTVSAVNREAKAGVRFTVTVPM